MVRLRQIALVGQDIDYSATTLGALLDTYVAFRDPGILGIGLFNILMQIGEDCFLEVVTPVDHSYEKNTTQVKSLRRNQGDCGYMVIMQVDDIAAAGQRISKLGRVATAQGMVAQSPVGKGLIGEKGIKYKIGDSIPKAPGTVASALIQWHPKDFGVLMETEEQWPPARGAEGAWLPAGNRWQEQLASGRHKASSVCSGYAAAELAVQGGADGVKAMAKKWSDGLGVPLVADGTAVQLEDEVTVRFKPIGPDGAEGLVGLDLYATPGKPKAFDEVKMHGVTWRLVDRPGAAQTKPLYETLAAKL